MTQWFIQVNDEDEQELGPFRPSELLKKVRDGEVTPETVLRKDNSAWFSASEVGGLFEAAMRPTIQYFCPQCDTEVGEPPVVCAYCGREIYKAVTKITENTISDGRQSLSEQAGNSVKKWLNKKRVSKPKEPE